MHAAVWFNISYRNINHPFIGNLSAAEDGNRRARTEGGCVGAGVGEKEKHIERARIEERRRV